MTKVNLKVPKLSGFDKSFQNLLTTQCGTLTPILTDEVIPNTKVHLKTALSASLPPLASDTFMRCNLKLESFFVPTRLLYGGFVSWLTGEKLFDNVSAEFTTAKLPSMVIPASSISGFDNTLVAAGSLADYLGIRSLSSTRVASSFNIFPFLCYHRIYDDWYRNPVIQSPVFSPVVSGDNTGYLSDLPYTYDGVVHSYSIADTFVDSVRLGDLRQRNFGFDPFTTALPTAQFGSQRSYSVRMDVSSGTASTFSISALRAANSMQQFSERHSIAGPRLQDWVKANYGADLSSGVAQRAILLGSGEVPVYSKGIFQNSNVDDSSLSSNNPFSTSVAAEYGTAVCTGEVELIKDFTANEPGYIMVIASLVPKVTYGSGVDPMLLRYSNLTDTADDYNYDIYSGLHTDMANPILQNVGNESIPSMILTGDISTSSSRLNIFGYQERFGFWKTKFDELHGLVRDGNSLESFALQRTTSGFPMIGTSFLKIPKDYLDQVSATSTAISQYGCWIDCYHDYKVAMPLAQYSIPSLQDPAYEHGEDVEVTLGGSRL